MADIVLTREGILKRQELRAKQKQRVKELIKVYAPFLAAGWKVARLHNPVINPKTGERECSCEEARRGWYPKKHPGEPYNPCTSPAKHTWGGKNPHKFTDIKKLGRVMERFPDANWALYPPINGLVLDTDPRSGGDEAFARMEEIDGKFPKTYRVITGGITEDGKRGTHDYLIIPEGAVPEGSRIMNTTGKKAAKELGPYYGVGLDIKTHTGLLVGPLSVHISGLTYEIAYPDVEIADAAHVPQPLLDKLIVEKEKKGLETNEKQAKAVVTRIRQINSSGSQRGSNLENWARKVLEGECEEIYNAPSHSGNDILFKRSCKVIEKCVETGLMSRGEVISALQATANARGGNSSGSKAARTIESAEEKVRGKPVFPLYRDSEKNARLQQVIDSNGTPDEIASAIPDDFYDSGISTSVVSDDDDIDYGPDSDHDLEFHAGATLTFEQNLLASDPEAYAAYDQAETEKQRIAADRAATAAHTAGTTTRRKKMSASQRTALDLAILRDQPSISRPSGIEDVCVLPTIAHDAEIPWNRCKKCNPKYYKRPCAECAARLLVTRPRPDDTPCRRGGKILIKPKDKRKQHKSAGFCPKCGGWGCPKCGYDNEADHLCNYGVFSQWLLDDLDQPILTLQSHDIESPKTEEVAVQHGVHRLEIDSDNRRRYGNKLTKLRAFYVATYAGSGNYIFYVILPMGINPKRLEYTPFDERGNKKEKLTPNVINFKRFDEELRQHFSNVGRFISLKKTDWEMCDRPAGAKASHWAVAYCKALRLAKRMISTEENERVGGIVLDDEGILDAAQEFGAAVGMGDTREIDRSHRRGYTQCLMQFWRFEFPEDTPIARINAFYARLTGKEKKKVEVADTATGLTQQNTNTGSKCLTYPLIT